MTLPSELPSFTSIIGYEEYIIYASIRQWYVAFLLMCVGLYIAETPDTWCLFGKQTALNKKPTVIQLAAVGQLANIFSSANEQQGNSADCSEENPLRYTCYY